MEPLVKSLIFIGKNKKKKYKKKKKSLDESLNEEKLYSTIKYNFAKNMQTSSLSKSEKVKHKKRKKIIPTNKNVDKFSNIFSNFSNTSEKDASKNIDPKISVSSKDIKFKNKKFLKKKQKKILDSQNVLNQYSNKILKTKKNKCLKLSQKSVSPKIHTKSKVSNQIVHTEEAECGNTSSLSDMSEESESSCDEYNQYSNQNDNEDDTDDDLEIRKELNSLSVYKEIQNLCKDNPKLFSSLCVSNKSDLMEIEETVQSSNFNKNTSNVITKERCKNLSKSSKDSSKSFTDSFKKSDTLLKRSNVDNVQTYQQEKVLQRDHSINSVKTSCSSILRNKAQEKLQAAKFRFLNEKLYTESGKDSFTYFQKNKDEFLDYHIGYNLQVSKWPMNPVNKIISSLQKLDKKLVIADMGCGDAKIAQALTHCVVHSFDLVALNEHVTPCNIARVPLSSDTVDVVVFCLSLMGTNLKDYLLEAFRILKKGGILKIAEVESRIPSLEKFIKSIESFGFTLDDQDIQQKLFVLLSFKKDKKRKKTQDVMLNPCLYKKR